MIISRKLNLLQNKENYMKIISVYLDTNANRYAQESCREIPPLRTYSFLKISSFSKIHGPLKMNPKIVIWSSLPKIGALIVRSPERSPFSPDFNSKLTFLYLCFIFSMHMH